MSVLDDLFSRRVLFVTGKGGVGKSTMAAALALEGAEREKRTLLVAVEAKGDAARFLDAGPSSYAPKQARPGLWHLALQPDQVLDEYLRVALKLPRMYRVGPLHKVFDFISTAAPGVREVLISGKVGVEERATDDGRTRWDLIVVDAAPSGQVLSHLRGPRTLQELVSVGMIRNQTEWVRVVLEDPAITGIVVVSLAEEMPVAETAELVDATPKQIDTPVLAIIANRIVEPLVHAAELARVGGHADQVGASLDPLVDAVGLSERIAANQEPMRARLRELGPPVLEVPLVPVARHTLRTTEALADALKQADA